MFTLGWTTYVIYLPKLAADVGIAPSAVILILMLDQAIFTVTDTAMGIFADKIAPDRRPARRVRGVADGVVMRGFRGAAHRRNRARGSQAIFIALIVIWSVTSSALRAPPLTLLGKYGARPQLPFLSALAMLGYGVAGAVSPYLGVTLRNQDPRLPFVISSVVLLITAMALSKVERGLSQAPKIETKQPAKPLGAVPVAFIATMVILALGYQLHFSINSAPFFLRFAKPADLEWLMPVFWIGFNIAMFPASVIVSQAPAASCRRVAVCRVAQSVAVVGAEMAASLNMLIAAQFLAGAAWGCMLMSAFSAVSALGETGAEGKVVGLVFSALALGTFARMASPAPRGPLRGIRAAIALGAGCVLVGGRGGPAGAWAPVARHRSPAQMGTSSLARLEG